MTQMKIDAVSHVDPKTLAYRLVEFQRPSVGGHESSTVFSGISTSIGVSCWPQPLVGRSPESPESRESSRQIQIGSAWPLAGTRARFPHSCSTRMERPLHRFLTSTTVLVSCLRVASLAGNESPSQKAVHVIFANSGIGPKITETLSSNGS